eukprot:CAMPEP_0175808496 /NCGR_PEP_ID=MMETSP0107_2-20121207/2290_1 /TAXON_ID=195067 ORGANISM="Goniomonas pacifica, Strain CCMP1869" /NCGR_SAMPLE_ID=MMETSP0107_2 /ASSEMBLY_ACC=CAM_ASM_000203 /LENGTH=121 /DNA_ID=CAMNT_0017120127 /DNA_START=200 /DNA_END=566 /DNA_ORIENTATION=-
MKHVVPCHPILRREHKASILLVRDYAAQGAVWMIEPGAEVGQLLVLSESGPAHTTWAHVNEDGEQLGVAVAVQPVVVAVAQGVVLDDEIGLWDVEASTVGEALEKGSLESGVAPHSLHDLR